MNNRNEQLISSSQLAIDALRKLSSDDHQEVISRLEWCIGSYQHDGNHEGLLSQSAQTLDILKKVKAASPRKVNKKVIDALEKVQKSK